MSEGKGNVRKSICMASNDSVELGVIILSGLHCKQKGKAIMGYLLAGFIGFVVGGISLMMFLLVYACGEREKQEEQKEQALLLKWEKEEEMERDKLGGIKDDK